MKRSLAKDVRAAVRDALDQRVKVEIGFRNKPDDDLSANCLEWDECADLCDMRRPEDVDVPSEGVVRLDLYCYGIGRDGELVTNVDVWIKDGSVVDAYDSVCGEDSRRWESAARVKCGLPAEGGML